MDGTPGNNVMPGRIVFKTATTDGVAERLRITKEGYLYIRDNGVTQTNTTLSYQSEGAFLTHYTARTTAGGDKYRRMFDIASVGANPWGSSIRFLTSADSTNPAVTVERVRIDHNGRVGINKTTPQTMLSIKAERSAVPRFGIDGHYSDSSYTQSTWDDSSGLYTLLGVNHQLDANGNDATPTSSLHSASIFLDGRGGNIRFYVKPNSGTSFTEAARITDNGRFGIGTGTPDHKFEVEDNNSSVAVSRSGANAQVLFKSNSVGQVGQIQVSESSGGGSIEIHSKNTSGTLIERVRIHPNGDFFVNSTNNSITAQPAFYSHAASGCGSYRPHSGFPIHHFYSNAGGTYSLESYVNGDGSYVNLSDYRLKENIVSISNGIDIVKQLNPVKFDWKSSSKTKNDLGFIAHEVQTLIPTAVDGTKDQMKEDGSPFYQGIAQTKIIPYLTAALKEAITKIEKLEQDNIALRVRVTNLEGN